MTWVRVAKLTSLIFLCIQIGNSSAFAAVWEHSNSWDQTWEDKYSEFIENEFDENFFMHGKWAGVSHDCADAVYFSRAIFAMENKLPFEFRDSTGGQKRITNMMSRWDGKEPLQKMKSFLNYVADMVGTKTLPTDSYPVKIDREYVRSGTIWSRPRITEKNFLAKLFGGNVKELPGHAEIVKNVSETGAVYLIGSTVPRAQRKLITTSSLVFMPIETSTGFRKWMQPADYDKRETQLDGYSLDQFKIGASKNNQNIDPSNTFPGIDPSATSTGERNIGDWVNDVQSSLALRAESKEEALQRFADNLCTLVQARVEIITKSEEYRLKVADRCMNAEEYDAYSTPSRDKRIRETLWSTLEMADANGGFLSRVKPEKIDKYLASCKEIEYLPGQKMTLKNYVRIIIEELESSNPNTTLLARWGLKEEENSCPEY